MSAVTAEVMDLVQLATGLTVLTAGLMVLCLLVAGLCACTSSRRKTVKHYLHIGPAVCSGRPLGA